jgi:hypothetical protein
LPTRPTSATPFSTMTSCRSRATRRSPSSCMRSLKISSRRAGCTAGLGHIRL